MDFGQTHSGLPEMPVGTATHAQETPKSQHNEAQKPNFHSHANLLPSHKAPVQ